MGEEEKKGFPTWLIVLLAVVGGGGVLCVGTAIVAAIAIPSLLRSRIAANESSAVGVLRSLVTAESTWRQIDADRNTVSDYWTADVSGFYRIENKEGSGIGIAMMDVAVAMADDDRLGQGNALDGGRVKKTDVKTAGVLPLARTAPKSGFWFRAIPLNAQEEPYATDPDGDGNAWTNAAEFAFQARPERYDQTGLNTFIVSESGVIFGQDFGNATAGNVPRWPGGNPTSQGWRVVQ